MDEQMDINIDEEPQFVHKLKLRREVLSSSVDLKEDEYIKYLEEFLNDSGDIDAVFSSKICESFTILIRAICQGWEKIVSYSLEQGAKIEKEAVFEKPHIFKKTCQNQLWNALEIAIWKYCDYRPNRLGLHPSHKIRKNIYETVKQKSLEKFSVYGLCPIHIECALGRWDKVSKLLGSLDADTSVSKMLNAAVHSESPLWPRYTPLLIAAKFNRRYLISRLLEIGASPNAKDSQGKTPLDYTLSYHFFGDERLFVYEEDGSLTYMSHFHIACYLKNLKVVKAYLDKGISPNIPVKRRDILTNSKQSPKVGETGLHIAVPKLACEYDRGYDFSEDDPCFDLARLLLEYGANVEQKDAKGRNPLQKCVNVMHLTKKLWNSSPFHSDYVKCLKFTCVLMESGVNADSALKFHARKLSSFKFPIFRGAPLRTNFILLCCLQRIMILRKDLITKKMKLSYKMLKSARYYRPIYKIEDYSVSCMVELSEIESLGLLQELEDRTGFVRRDYKRKFGDFIGSSELPQRYPIYGNLLKIKLGKRLCQLQRKKQMIEEAIPLMSFLVPTYCKLPYSCADHILRYLTNQELEQFIEIFNKNKNLE